MAKTKAPNGQPGPAVTDDGGPELAQQRLDGVLPGFQAARVQPVLVVGRGSRFPLATARRSYPVTDS